MNPPVEHPPGRDAASGDAHLDARRRLLRGSFGVPAVLTLATGSAMAASSPIRCFNNAPADAKDSSSSNWSIQQYLGATASGNTAVYVVRAEDITALATVDGMIKAPAFVSGTWVQINTFTVIDVKGGSNAPVADGGNKVAPRFTRTGGTDAAPVFTVTGLVPVGSSGPTSGSNVGKIISKSCWSSFT